MKSAHLSMCTTCTLRHQCTDGTGVRLGSTKWLATPGTCACQATQQWTVQARQGQKAENIVVAQQDALRTYRAHVGCRCSCGTQHTQRAKQRASLRGCLYEPAQAGGGQQMPQDCSPAVRLTFSGLSSASTGTFSMADRTFKPAAGKCRLEGAQLETLKRKCDGSRAPPTAMAVAALE